jgi:hypothetical protein
VLELCQCAQVRGDVQAAARPASALMDLRGSAEQAGIQCQLTGLWSGRDANCACYTKWTEPETASKPRFRLEDRPYQSDWCRPPLQERWSPVCVHTKDVPYVSQHPRMNNMPDVEDAQLRLQFLGRKCDASECDGDSLASDPAHDPNALLVEALKKPHVLSIYNPAFRAIQKESRTGRFTERDRAW